MNVKFISRRPRLKLLPEDETRLCARLSPWPTPAPLRDKFSEALNYKFTNVHLDAEADFSGGLNGLTLSAASGDAITISLINGMTANDIIGFKAVYKYNPDDAADESYEQTIQVDTLKFNSIKVKKELKVIEMGG